MVQVILGQQRSASLHQRISLIALKFEPWCSTRVMSGPPFIITCAFKLYLGWLRISFRTNTATRTTRRFTVNARISTQLQIGARFELAPLLRLQIWNKRPFQISPPPPSPEKKRGSELGTIYETYTVLLMNVAFVIVQDLCSSKSYEFASHFLDRNIHVNSEVLHFITFLVKLCFQSPASCCYMLQFWLSTNKKCHFEAKN